MAISQLGGFSIVEFNNPRQLGLQCLRRTLSFRLSASYSLISSVAESLLLLEHEYRHRFRFPFRDEELDSQWGVWTLRRYLLLRRGIHNTLPPRVQMYATRSH